MALTYHHLNISVIDQKSIGGLQKFEEFLGLKRLKYKGELFHEIQRFHKCL